MRRLLISLFCAGWLIVMQVQGVLGVGTMVDDGKTLWGNVVAMGKVIVFGAVDWLLLAMMGGVTFGPRLVKHVRWLADQIGRISFRPSETNVSQFDTPILVVINHLIRTALIATRDPIWPNVTPLLRCSRRCVRASLRFFLRRAISPRRGPSLRGSATTWSRELSW